MRKVLYVTSTLRRTGPTAQLYNIIKYLDRDQFDPYLVTLSPESDDSRWDAFKSLKIKILSLNLSRFSGLFLGQSKFRDVVARIRPNIIHSQGVRGDFLVSNLDLQAVKLCTVRCFPQLDYVMTYGRVNGFILYLLHRKAMRGLDQCVGVSSAVCRNLIYELAVDRAVRIYNGVDTENYSRVGEQEKLELRSKLGLPPDCTIWISSGHLSTRKDPLMIVNAFKRNFERNKKNILVFVGDGPLKSELKKTINHSLNILVKGRVTNVADWLRASDYFVSASVAEGLPNAVLEALACGLPVLLSDIEPHREILEMEKRAGAIFKQRSVEALSEGFSFILSGGEGNMSYFAEKLAVEKLSARVMSQHYQALYDELVEVY